MRSWRASNLLPSLLKCGKKSDSKDEYVGMTIHGGYKYAIAWEGQGLVLAFGYQHTRFHSLYQFSIPLTKFTYQITKNRQKRLWAGALALQLQWELDHCHEYSLENVDFLKSVVSQGGKESAKSSCLFLYSLTTCYLVLILQLWLFTANSSYIPAHRDHTRLSMNFTFTKYDLA